MIEYVGLKALVLDYIKEKPRTRKQIFKKFKYENQDTLRGILSVLKKAKWIKKTELWDSV